MTYHDDLMEWRRQVEASLRGEESWLSLAGLFWLAAGENTIGAAPENAIRLPEGTAPAVAGRIDFDGRQAVFRAAPGAAACVEDRSVETITLEADADGPRTRVRLGDITFIVIRRGDRWGVRVWNRKHPARSAFPGRRWFPIDEAHIMPARFVPYDPPRPMVMANVLGDSETTPCPGHLEFLPRGAAARLLVTEAGPDSLFVLFTDLTNGQTTYPAGRILIAQAGGGQAVTLDFNRAYNPPCAFTPYATCPLPPTENRLSVAIEAGEQYDPAWHSD